MSGYSIKNMGLEDIPVLCKLLEALFRKEPDFYVNTEAQARGLELLYNSDSGIVKTAWKNSELIGMASGQIVFSTSEGAPSVWIEDVMVADAHRGQGVGKLLLASVEAWGISLGAKRFQLVADKDNTRAQVFYESQNWTGTNLMVLKKRI